MMKNKTILTGITVGFFYGILDTIPMFIMEMTWDTIISAFLMCVIGGFLIASSNLQTRYLWKGIIIFFLLALPTIITVGSQAPQEVAPMIVTNLLLGALMGFTIGKFASKSEDVDKAVN